MQTARNIVLLFMLAVFAGCGGKPSISTARQNKVGYTSAEFFDADRQRPMKLKLWYPAVSTANETAVTYSRLFKGWAAPAAAYMQGTHRRALILLSHGTNGGNANQSWLAEALAGSGYIVAGHSAGGYAALALAGAEYRNQLMGLYCSNNTGRDCVLAAGIDWTRVDFSREPIPHRDSRFKAVFAMAPAVGAGIVPESLARVNTPVMVVAAEDDEWLPLAVNAKKYADIKGAELIVLPAGGHFVFLSECNTLGKIIGVFVRDDICGLKSSVDRSAIHAKLTTLALDFFANNLPPSP